MGVFKWLRREREGDREAAPGPSLPYIPDNIRTEAYKRDLAEFQARRSHKPELPDTPVKKSRCGRNSLPVSCTDCTSPAPDNTFNYEKKSAMKYKKNKRQRTKSAEERASYDGVPNIQFLFQNQVFMPGNVFAQASFSEPVKTKRRYAHTAVRSKYDDFKLVRKQINFTEEDDGVDTPPMFYKNNCLSTDPKDFLASFGTDMEEVDNPKGLGNKHSSRSTDVGDNSGDKLEEVMSELKIFDQWADEQLKLNSVNSSRSNDSKSDTSTYSLPVVTISNLDVTIENHKKWNYGHWGTIPIQIKKLPGVSMDQVKRKQNVEINILRKCRHPNIILLMGLYSEIHDTIHLVCERCVDTLFGILHVQGRILSAQTAVQYVADIASALVFLHMQSYIHTELNSMCIMITNHDAAKLVDLTSCAKYPGVKSKKTDKKQRLHLCEPHYVNIENNYEATLDNKPLISTSPSEVYLSSYSVPKEYGIYRNSEHYRWQAPELFTPDDSEKVYPCSRSDVYSLSMILWECCNATVPWKSLSYEKIKELYTVWKARVHLPVDGTYPGCLLDLLQSGLKLDRAQRMDITTMAERLQMVKRNLENLEYIVIPARLSKKKPKSPIIWDPQTPTDSSSQSPLPRSLLYAVDVHRTRSSTTDSSEKDCSKGSEPSPLYEIIEQHTANGIYSTLDTLYESNEKIPDITKLKEINKPKLSDGDFSSACSTPISKVKTKLKEIGTPGAALHKSDSTEYCSIMSPDTRVFNLDSNVYSDMYGTVENPTAKLLSRSFTPKSYKPLHIRVPEFKNLEGLKSLTKEGNVSGSSSYNFDIQSYSLPNTPIARSNKLRKNAWLSGELNASDKCGRQKDLPDQLPEENKESKQEKSACETSNAEITSTNSRSSRRQDNEDFLKQNTDSPETDGDIILVKRVDATRADESALHSWFLKPPESADFIPSRQEEESLLHVNVKPLVAIHERWIREAGRKTGRSMSLPEDNRSQIPVLKPASHRVDTFQKSLPLLTANRAECKPFKFTTSSSFNGRSREGIQSEQFCQVRSFIAKRTDLQTKDAEQQTSAICITPERSNSEPKIDQATDTAGIEEFIKELIRKEMRQFTHISGNVPPGPQEYVINKGAVNIMEALKTAENTEVHAHYKDSPLKSFSRVKINGNNKPLLQITFSRTGENCLQVLDNCVNVTICDTNSTKDKTHQSNEDAQSLDDYQSNSLKRCQAFNALQEARSTEDLYIDDDFSTHMQENFGGKVKLIPLHGSLHEILCEKEDDCCLIKVKQENGCDTIYFKCDNSDTESRDALDGMARDNVQDTVVFKRSISLVEERIQRVIPKEKRCRMQVNKNHTTNQNEPKENDRQRPASEISNRSIDRDTRFLSNSSPSLAKTDERANEVELNIENVMCYQDSSSDESLKCQADDDFEILERKIEEDVAKSSLFSCGFLEKISEENLSVMNEEFMDQDFGNEKLYIE